MKKIKKIIYVVLGIFLIGISSESAFAADNSQVVYNGEGQEMVMTKGNDLFLNFKELAPGDFTQQTVDIKNNSDGAFHLRLRAEAVENKPLLEELVLTVSSKSADTDNFTQIYSGPASGSASADLGSYTAGYEGKIKVQLKVPETLSNEQAGTQARIKWIFSTESFSGESGNTPVTAGPAAKMASVVKFVTTGDYAPVVWLAVSMGVSAAVISSVLLRKNKTT